MSASPEKGSPKQLWRWLRVGFVALALLLPVVGRAAIEGRAELRAAQTAAGEGELERAIAHYGRAARWRCPLARHDEEGVAALLDLGQGAEQVGDRLTALTAFREVRGALLGTRVFAVPQPEAFELANQRIAALMAQQEAEAGTDVGGTGDSQAFHADLLGDLPGPRPIWATLSVLSFLGFIAACVGLFRYGIDENDRPVPRQATRFGVAILLGIVSCLLCLRFS